jgi:hypothetical protein
MVLQIYDACSGTRQHVQSFQPRPGQFISISTERTMSLVLNPVNEIMKQGRRAVAIPWPLIAPTVRTL